MFRDYFEARSDCEPQQREEWILVPNAIHVVAACSPDQVSGRLVASKKPFQNAWLYLLGRFYFLGRSRSGSTRIWSDEVANEPAAEPTELDFVDCFALATFQGLRNCWYEGFIGDSEMLQALTYAPRPWPGLPVELRSAESLRNRFGASIGGIQFVDQARRPMG